MKTKIASIIILFIALLALLIWQGLGGGTSTVMMPSEVIASTQDLKRVRVAGRVTNTEARYEVEPGFKLEFFITDPKKEGEEAVDPVELSVYYQGIKPDMFASGRDVIIDGDFVAGQLIAHKLMTQCPSKYEPPEPTQEISTQPNHLG